MTNLKIPNGLPRADKDHLKALLKEIKRLNQDGNIPEALNTANSFKLYRDEALLRRRRVFAYG